jgi:hypothetical protein
MLGLMKANPPLMMHSIMHIFSNDGPDMSAIKGFITNFDSITTRAQILTVCKKDSISLTLFLGTHQAHLLHGATLRMLHFTRIGTALARPSRQREHQHYLFTLSVVHLMNGVFNFLYIFGRDTQFG